MKKVSILTAVLLLGFGFSSIGRADIPPTEAGKAAANAWLQLVDEGRYGEAWRDASDYFRSDVTEDKWVDMMNSGRTSLGSVMDRKFMSQPAFRRSIPGAPDGEYVVVEYDTTFKNKAAVVEKVTVVKEADGVWRVSAYIMGY